MKFKIELIEKYMKENNLTKIEFCKQCGITISALNRFLASDTSLRGHVLYKIVITINARAGELLNLEN